jgi:hypothetical protein
MALIDFVFTRAGEATRTAQNGQVETVPANFPVVNFSGGELLGYLSAPDDGMGRGADIATASGLTLSPLSNVQFKANFPTDYPLVIAGTTSDRFGLPDDTARTFTDREDAVRGRG